MSRTKRTVSEADGTRNKADEAILVDSAAETGTALGLPERHASDESLLLLSRVDLLLCVDRFLISFSVLVDVLLLMLCLGLLFVGLRLHFLLRKDLLAAIHAGGLVQAMWKAERTAILIGNDGSRRERVVAAAILSMGTGVAHSY